MSRTVPLASSSGSILRYYTSVVHLKLVHSAKSPTRPDAYLALEDAVPHSKSFMSSSSSSFAQSSTSLLISSPSSVSDDLRGSYTNEHEPVEPTEWTITPAPGFEKRKDQPVCYQDPVQLQTSDGRTLGIIQKSPYVGYVAAGGDSGAMVFVFEQDDPQQSQPDREPSPIFDDEEVDDADSTFDKLPKLLPFKVASNGLEKRRKLTMMDRQNTMSTVVSIKGGDHVWIRGLGTVARKASTKTSYIVQRKQETASSSICCEISLQTTSLDSSLNDSAVLSDSSSSGRGSVEASRRNSRSQSQTAADRTATGDFVGVLHQGELMLRSRNFVKIWKKGYFVLTQVALHRFGEGTNATNVSSAKPKASIMLHDCRKVLYEKFSKPHNFDVEMKNGPKLSLRCNEAVACAKWASVLSHAIESPEWVHADDSYVTVWRSDEHYTSCYCPSIRDVLITHLTMQQSLDDTIGWGQQIYLGNMNINSSVEIVLSDGNKFTLSLEELASAVVSPRWTSQTTMMDIRGATEVPASHRRTEIEEQFGPETHVPRSRAGSSKSQFLVRLKFQAQLQTNSSFTLMSKTLMKPAIGGIVAVCGVALAALSQHCHMVLAVVLLAGFLAAFVVVLWKLEIGFKPLLGPKRLDWYLTLAALEVHPDSKGATAKNAREMEEKQWTSSRSLPTHTRVFRIETALDSILTVPRTNFRAIKRGFPHEFLTSDDNKQKEKTLVVSLGSVNWQLLKVHGVSKEQVGRYWLYLWEYMWTYQVKRRDNMHRLSLILDCRNCTLSSFAESHVRIMLEILTISTQHYPNRISNVTLVCQGASSNLFAQAFIHVLLPPALRTVCEVLTMDPESDPKTYQPLLDNLDAVNKLKKPKTHDDQDLAHFVDSVLAKHASKSIPPFTSEELAIAAAYTQYGSTDGLKGRRSSSAGESLSSSAIVNWENVTSGDGFSLYISTPEEWTQDDGLVQWRGIVDLHTPDEERALGYLKDPVRLMRWVNADDEIVVLDSVSDIEDVCFWTQKLAFLPSNDTRKQRVYDSVVRRTWGNVPDSDDLMVLWKTKTLSRLLAQTSSPSQIQDPVASVCFVLETGGDELRLHFWYQTLLPALSDHDISEVGGRLEGMFRSLVACVQKTRWGAASRS